MLLAALLAAQVSLQDCGLLLRSGAAPPNTLPVQAFAHSLTPLEALRFSQQEAQEDLAQPGRHLAEFLTSNKAQHPDLALRQAQHDYCGRGIPPERLIVGKSWTHGCLLSVPQRRSMCPETAVAGNRASREGTTAVACSACDLGSYACPTLHMQ